MSRNYIRAITTVLACIGGARLFGYVFGGVGILTGAIVGVIASFVAIAWVIEHDKKAWWQFLFQAMPLAAIEVAVASVIFGGIGFALTFLLGEWSMPVGGIIGAMLVGGRAYVTLRRFLKRREACGGAPSS